MPTSRSRTSPATTRRRWLERHRNALEWVSDSGVLGTCAELGDPAELVPARRSRPAA